MFLHIYLVGNYGWYQGKVKQVLYLGISQVRPKFQKVMVGGDGPCMDG